jgi:hypothetical protein
MAWILKVIIATLMVIVCGDSFGQAVPPDAGINPLIPIITVAYDNNPYREGVETA